jgi:hypothetical protein
MRTTGTDKPAEELHLGGGGMWAPMEPSDAHPQEWACQVDEVDAPAVVRSVD